MHTTASEEEENADEIGDFENGIVRMKGNPPPPSKNTRKNKELKSIAVDDESNFDGIGMTKDLNYMYKYNSTDENSFENTNPAYSRNIKTKEFSSKRGLGKGKRSVSTRAVDVTKAKHPMSQMRGDSTQTVSLYDEYSDDDVQFQYAIQDSAARLKKNKSSKRKK